MLVTIAFAGEPDRNLVVRLQPDASLRQVREQLAALDAMAPADRFLFGNVRMDPSIEADTKLKEVISEDCMLSVRPPPRAPEPEPEPEPPRLSVGDVVALLRCVGWILLIVGWILHGGDAPVAW